MAEVQWIKLKVGMFDGTSFKRIKRAKIGGESFRDKLTAVWFELLDFAGKCNHGGQFIDDREIPFRSISDIATMIDRDDDELELCMRFYIKEGMIEIIDDIYALSTWDIYQNEEKLQALREKKNARQQRWREKKRLQSSTSPSTECLPSIIEEEREKEKEEEYHSFIHSAENDKKFLDEDERREALLSQQRTALNGPLGGGVVFLSDEQMNDLLEKLSLDEFHHYIGIVRDCELKGKSYKKKTHYQAILDMAIKDRKVLPNGG